MQCVGVVVVALLVGNTVAVCASYGEFPAADSGSTERRRPQGLSRPRPTCQPPTFLDATIHVPSHIATRIRRIWQARKPGTPCEMEMARTRNLLDSLHPRRLAAFAGGSGGCQVPLAVMAALPQRYSTKLQRIWQTRDKSTHCRTQRRQTRLVLLNLPPSVAVALRTPPFQCEPPPFLSRLEPELQRKLQRVWTGYVAGAPCFERVDAQLALLQRHEISLGSFRFPPAGTAVKILLYQKFRRASRA